jgi:hypothetical protein
MTDVLVRDANSGQFRPASAAEVTNDYLQDQLGATLHELMRIYEQVTESRVGRWLFAD